MRRVPDLSFHIDKSEKFQSRIDELLGRVKKRQKSVPDAPATDSASDTPALKTNTSE